MKPDDENAKEAREILAPLAEAPPTFDPARRDAVWRQIQAEQHQTRAGFRVGLAAAVVTAAAAAWLLMIPTTPTEPTEAAAPTVAENAPAPAPVNLAGETLRGSRTLPSGAEVVVQGEVLVAMASATDTRLVLKHGSVRNTVPKLAPGARYVVDAPLAEVAVRGTVFEVRLTDDGATEVEVTEGAVAVEPKDGRAGALVVPGKSHRVEPLTEKGAKSAEARGDWRQAIEIWRALADKSSGDLNRRNLVLRAGRLMNAHSPTEAAAWWRNAAERYGDGTHAEEFAFRLAEALHHSGLSGEARVAAKVFRQRFPDSDRAAETLGW